MSYFGRIIKNSMLCLLSSYITNISKYGTGKVSAVIWQSQSFLKYIMSYSFIEITHSTYNNTEQNNTDGSKICVKSYMHIISLCSNIKLCMHGCYIMFVIWLQQSRWF